jgi:hypothetical protein
MSNLLSKAKFTRVHNTTAGGSGDTILSSAIDMKGFDAVIFLVAFGAIAGTGAATVKAQQSHDNSADTFADLTGTGVAVGDTNDNHVVLLEIVKPQERYVKCAVARATANVAIDSIIAIQTGPNKEPVTQDVTTIIASEIHASPAEGTA